MATMIPTDIGEFETEGEKAFYPGNGNLGLWPGCRPRRSSGATAFAHRAPTSSSRELPTYVHYLCWYTPDIMQ